MSQTYKWIACFMLLPVLFVQAVNGTERVTVDFDYVKEQAHKLAKNPYDDKWGEVPSFLNQLGYDDYLQIRFNTDEAMWGKEELPFRVEFFHPGFIYNRALTIHEFTETHEQKVRFVKDFFDYGNNKAIAEKIPTSLGYAGFRILNPLNEAGKFDELIHFLGSSYFRAIGRDQTYGLSTRGLALNITSASQTEEFPAFREFWLGKPSSNATMLTVYALLDSLSVTGAYRFDILPGETTSVAVQSTLFFRTPVEQVGFAPLSSMFFFGENTPVKPPDYRPEVHDSDGLLIQQPDGQHLWRPLLNPMQKRIGSFHFDAPVAFGLCQRDRDFNNYQDIHAAYHRRPSVWIQPGEGDWGSGNVVLYEFGHKGEFADNVTVFWQPDRTFPVNEPVSLQYTLHFTAKELSPQNRIAATRLGRSLLRPELHEFVVDFAGEELAGLSEIDDVTAVVDTSAEVQLEHQILQKNPYNQTWRLLLQFSLSEPTTQHEFRAFLAKDQKILTEIWTYLWVKPFEINPTP